MFSFPSFKKTNIDPPPIPLFQYFMQLSSEPIFPFKLAFEDYLKMEEAGERPIDQEILYSHLAIRELKNFFLSIKEAENPLEVIDLFSEGQEAREIQLRKEAHHHLEFLEWGTCLGCPHCQTHHQVPESLKDEDSLFLFISLKSILYTLEHLLYDIVTKNPEIILSMTLESLSRLESSISEYCQKKISLHLAD